MATEKNFLKEKEDAYKILIDTVQNKKKHKNYDRVVALADLYKKLITGDKISELLERFVRREDPALFEQRKAFTHAITPAVSSSLMNPFYKVGRVNPIANKIHVDKDDVELKKAISKYNGDKSVLEYMDGRFVDLSFTDPNAFLLTEFDTPELGPRGDMTEKVKPRPLEVSCQQAINFFYDNSILQWLIVQLECTYIADGKPQVGKSYTIYLPNVQVKFTQIDATLYSGVQDGKTAEVETTEGVITLYRVSANELYLAQYFEHKAGKVQGSRIGYKRDLVTDGETYVNPMHDAMPYFMKSIKTVSEFDLTMGLHAFPQKFQYVNRCSADGCNGGLGPEGGVCIGCGGTGFSVHASAQDGILIRLPKNKDEMFPLEQMVHYERPPVDILEFQDKFIKELKNEARQAMYNSEVFSKTEVVATAYEMKISMESVYDTLFSFGEQWTKTYKYIVTIIASFTDYEKVDIDYRLPKDFKFKTVSDLLGELKTATESNAPGYIKQEISADLSEQLFIDKPNELKRVRAKQRFFPFPDKTPTEIVYIISNGLTSEYNKILWANFDSIFFKLETEALKSGKDFYSLEFTKQKEAIEAAVNELATQINGEAPAPASAFGSTEPGDDGGVE